MRSHNCEKWLFPTSCLTLLLVCLSVCPHAKTRLPPGGYKNVTCTPVQALRLCTGRTAHRGSRGIALLFLNHGTRRGWEVSVTLRPLFTPGKTRYPLYRRLGGSQGRSGQVRKISPTPRLDHRTVQPVASSYTDCATRPTLEGYSGQIIFERFSKNISRNFKFH